MSIPEPQSAENYLDTEIVRSTFRKMVQFTTCLCAFTGLCHAAILYWGGEPLWWWICLLVLTNIPIYLATDIKRSYPVFLTALLIFLGIILSYLIFLSLRYGVQAGFHYMLLPIATLLMISGRIGLYSKWILVFALMLLLLRVDHVSASRIGLVYLPPSVMMLLRDFNLITTLFFLVILAQQYFLVIAKAQGLLMEQAFSDPLTGLCNRRRFHDVFAMEAANVRRYQHSLSVIMADIDYFKRVNDQFGHDVGDAVIRYVGGKIKECARENDCVCRWGGEEFLVMLSQTDASGARLVAERIAQQVSGRSVELMGVTLDITLTMGVVCYGQAGLLDDLVKRADAALYIGKAQGRNRIIVALD